MASTEPWVDLLAADRSLLDRTSTAERVADMLRQQIIEGRVSPGTRLSEQRAAEALTVSRNTLREAFRLLVHERLLIHEFHRGVSVRMLSAADVIDLYRMRRLLETSAVLRAGTVSTRAAAAISDAVSEGENAAAREEWLDVGTANMRFHQNVAALADSARVDETMRQLLAELRLAFHVMKRPRDFHEHYLVFNRKIADLISSGDLPEAANQLDHYFDVAEHQLVAAFASQRNEELVSPDSE